MSIDVRTILRVTTHPETGRFKRLLLSGKLGHVPPTPQDEERETFLLDTGAQALCLPKRMVAQASADAVEWIETGKQKAQVGVCIPRECIGDYALVWLGGYVWTYEMARVKFILYEEWPIADAIAAFRADNARILCDVVDLDPLNAQFVIREIRPPTDDEVIRPLVGCDPVLQECVLLTDPGDGQSRSVSVLVVDSCAVQEAWRYVLQPGSGKGELGETFGIEK